MKTCKAALMLFGCLSLLVSTLPALALNNPPDCFMANYDKDRDIFTVLNPVPGEISQQCLLTVLPGNRSLYLAARPLHAAPQFTEGTYAITLAGVGGGGGSELTQEGIEGGGGAAAPLVTNHYLAAGTYRLTLGAGGEVTRASGASGRHGFISIRPL